MQAEGPFVSQTQIYTPKRLCTHLRGSHYEPYIQLTRTRNFGGISPLTFALLSRRHFPYKPFPALKGESEPAERPATPPDGNLHTDVAKWTESEWRQAKHLLSGFSRWEVDLAGSFVKSTRCKQETYNSDSVCDACRSVAKDESFMRAVRRVCESPVYCQSFIYLHLETARSSTAP